MKPPTLRDCLEAETQTVRAFLKKRATISGDKFWFFKSPAQGKVVTVVSHIDTVYDSTKKELWSQSHQKWIKPDRKHARILHDKKHDIYWSPDGLGADDRAGVYGCLHLMARFKPESAPHFLFCDEEESGCAGAIEASEKLVDIIKDTLFMIELDRRNDNDCVFYNDEGKDFIRQIEKYGYRKEWGSLSDITHLGKAASISAVNLSVGYYGEHTKEEYLEAKTLRDTLQRTFQMVTDAHKDQTTYPNVYKPKPALSGYLFDRDYDYGYSGWGQYGYSRAKAWRGYRDPVKKNKGNGGSPGEKDYNICQHGTPYPKQISDNLTKNDEAPDRYIQELREWMVQEGYGV